MYILSILRIVCGLMQTVLPREFACTPLYTLSKYELSCCGAENVPDFQAETSGI